MCQQRDVTMQDSVKLNKDLMLRIQVLQARHQKEISKQFARTSLLALGQPSRLLIGQAPET
jgi:hypothetical protein